MASHITFYANLFKSLEPFWPSRKIGAGLGSALTGCFGLGNGRGERVSCL